MNRGEVWYVNLDPTIGSEIKKTRRAVIVSNDSLGKLPIKVIVPLTSWQDKFKDVPWMVRIAPDRFNKLDKASAADAFQIRAVSVERFDSQAGYLTKDVMDLIIEAVVTVVSDI